jgi:hypothetical protein
MKKIKSIKTVQTDIDGTSFTSEYLEYNNENELTLSIKYDAEGNVIEKNVNVFDNGKKVNEKNYTSEEELAEEHDFEYDDEEKLIKEKIKYAEGYEAVRKFIRDNDRRELRIEELDEDGKLEEHTVQKYDEKNRLIEKAAYDYLGKLETAVSLHYDDHGQVLVQEEYEKKMKKPVRIREYTYTESGEIKTMLVKNRKGKVIDNYVLKYDNEGRLLEQRSVQSGAIAREYEDGLLKTEVLTDAAGNIQTKTDYDYDEHGNIISESNEMIRKDHDIQYHD